MWSRAVMSLMRHPTTSTQGLAAASTAFKTFATAAAAAAAPAPSSSAGPKLPPAPLRLEGISGAVASLTWQIAAKENQLEKVQDELAQVVHLFTTEPELLRLAVDPFVPAIVRNQVVKKVFGAPQASEIIKRLLDGLAEENALASILTVASAYDELMLAHKKEVYCTIITSQVMDKLEKVELRSQAEKFVEPGFKLVMKEKVDKKILGGFILEFEDRRVDMSSAKKTEEFNALVSKLESDLL